MQNLTSLKAAPSKHSCFHGFYFEMHSTLNFPISGVNLQLPWCCLTLQRPGETTGMLNDVNTPTHTNTGTNTHKHGHTNTCACARSHTHTHVRAHTTQLAFGVPTALARPSSAASPLTATLWGTLNSTTERFLATKSDQQNSLTEHRIILENSIHSSPLFICAVTFK